MFIFNNHRRSVAHMVRKEGQWVFSTAPLQIAPNQNKLQALIFILLRGTATSPTPNPTAPAIKEVSWDMGMGAGHAASVHVPMSHLGDCWDG